MRGNGGQTSPLNPEETKTPGSPTSGTLGGLGGWGAAGLPLPPPQAASLARLRLIYNT